MYQSIFECSNYDIADRVRSVVNNGFENIDIIPQAAKFVKITQQRKSTGDKSPVLLVYQDLTIFWIVSEMGRNISLAVDTVI